MLVSVDEPSAFGVMLFPNPTTNFFQLSWTDPSISTLSIEIKDMTGRTVKMIEGVGRDEAVGVRFLPQGVYFLSLYHDEKLLRLEKLIIIR